MNEIREELIKIFDINSPISSNLYDLDPNNLLVSEENGYCQYDKIQENLTNRHPNIITLLDYESIKKLYALEDFMKKKVNFSLSNFVSDFITSFVSFVKDLIWSSNKNNLLSNNLSSLNLQHISINCLGNYLAFSSNGIKMLLINIPEKKKMFINFPQNEFINCIEWNPLIPYQFLVATNNTIFNCIIYNNEDNLDVKIKNTFQIYPNLIKIIYSKEKNFIILLYSNYFEIYNSFFENIFNKIFTTKNFIDCSINNSSTLFLVNSETEIFLFNMKNLQFKSYSNFSGRIVKVLFSPNNNFIFIFIESQSNELLLYVLYNINDDNYNIQFIQSYNNSISSYFHLKFKMFYNVFSLLKDLFIKIINIEINNSGDIIGILFLNKEGFNQLAIYKISIGLTIQQFLIKPLCFFSKFHNLNVNQFIFSYDYNEKKNILFCECSNELITKTHFLTENK
jgi:hypothetical protein